MAEVKPEYGWTLERKQQRFAELYVWECNFNATDAYYKLRKEVAPDVEITDKNLKVNAHRFKNTPECLACIEEVKNSAREQFEIDKGEIISALKDMAFPSETDKTVSRKIQMDAIKQLSKIAGLEQQNINLDTQQEIIVVIE